jgi:gamma-glutamylcysteine synthetase
VTFTPNERDLTYLRTYKFNDLTFRGTIEYRSCCCQPVRDALSVAAFHLGLAGTEANERLLRLLGEDNPLYDDSPPSILRRQLVLQAWSSSLDRAALKRLLLLVLELAQDGLIARGRGEERFLAPLYKRVERLENPAQRMLRLQCEGWSPEQIIRDYAMPAE